MIQSANERTWLNSQSVTVLVEHLTHDIGVFSVQVADVSEAKRWLLRRMGSGK